MKHVSTPEPDLRVGPTIGLPGGDANLPGQLSRDDVARFTALGLTRLETAHDLGNLLQVAASAIRLLDRSLCPAPDGEVGPLIRGALISLDRATMLGQRFLNAAQPRTADREILHLDAMLTDMADVITVAVGTGIHVLLRLDDDVPAIECDRADLENAVLNLVVNAKQAMSDRGLLTLSVGRDSDRMAASHERSHVVLSVSDTGCGMPARVAAQAFRPFFTTRSSNHGTGLGLATVAALASRLGGSAEIASVVGEGTTVTLRLPSCGA